MKDILGRINKAVDAFTDVLVEDISLTHEADIYTYKDLNIFIRKMRQQYPVIKKCKISITKSLQVGDKVYPSEKFLIRIVMLDEEARAIITDSEDEYLGRLVVASSIDQKLQDFMGEKPERTVKLKTEEV